MNVNQDKEGKKNHQLRQRILSVTAVLSNKCHKIITKINSWSLFEKIIAWVILALVAFIVLSMGLSGKGLILKNLVYLGIGAKPYQKTTITLTLVGGIGAVGYLVIKYQERTAAQRAEQRAIDEVEYNQLLTAIHLLGDDKASTRIAGVQSLIEIGQNRPETRQRVMDILCGYLRTDRGKKDGPVESTILKAMHEHLIDRRRYFTGSNDIIVIPHNELQIDADTNTFVIDNGSYWADMNIDLHNSVLTEEIDFNYIACDQFDLRNTQLKSTHTVNFRGARFEVSGSFREMRTTANVDFSGADFKNSADFSYVKLHKLDLAKANMKNSIFKGARLNDPDFSFSKLKSPRFENTIIEHGNFFSATLSSAQFKETKLNNSYFNKGTLINSIFSGATLNRTSFNRSTLGNTQFYNSKLNSINFYRGTLKSTDFTRVKFHKISFIDTNFEGQTSFHNSSFFEQANFKRSSIGAPSEDSHITFSTDQFFCEPDFTKVKYLDSAIFEETHFLKKSSHSILEDTARKANSSSSVPENIIFDLEPQDSKESDRTDAMTHQVKSSHSELPK